MFGAFKLRQFGAEFHQHFQGHTDVNTANLGQIHSGPIPARG